MVDAQVSEQSWPFDNQLVDENAWEAYFSPLAEDGVFGSPGSTVGQVYADGSGMLVKRRPVSGWIHGWYFRDASEKVLPIDPNPASTIRYDLIVERRNLVTNQTWTDVLKGTAGSPNAPAVTQVAGSVWEIPLGRVQVDPGVGVAGKPVQVINSNKITDARPFQGTRLWRVTSLSQLPVTAVPLWQEAVDFTGAKVRWDGKAWVDPLATQTATISMWQATKRLTAASGRDVLRYHRVEDWVYGWASYRVQGNSTIDGRIKIVMPAALPFADGVSGISVFGTWGCTATSVTAPTGGYQWSGTIGGNETNNLECALRVPISFTRMSYVGAPDDPASGLRVADGSIFSLNFAYRTA